MNDIFYIATWWILFVILGFTFLPITSILFSQFQDRGYIFSKVIAAVVISYLSLLLGTLHIVPFNIWSLSGILLICMAANIIVANKISFRKMIKPLWKVWLLEEVFFISGLCFWAFIRAHDPTINGLEKFMDFGFINSILDSTYFPPKDMWFPPHSINYYYFGHLVTAVLTRLSFLPSFISYNLMLATIFAFTFTCAFSIGLNLIAAIKKKIDKDSVIVGILAAMLTTFGGNLHTLYQFFHPYQNESPVPPWKLQFALSEYPNNYWYPNATRFIQNTIHEFPMYSYVVADLHGHVLSIPIVLTTLALILQIFLFVLQIKKQSHKTPNNFFAKTISKVSNFTSLSNHEIGYLVLVGLFVAVLYMTNAWDGPIYFGVTGIALFVAFFIKRKDWVVKTVSGILITLISFVIFSLPFSINFKPFVSGFGMNCPPDFLIKIGKIGPFLFEVDRCQRSPLYQWLILWGFFLFFALCFVIFKFFKRKLKDVLNPIDWLVIGISLLAFTLLIIPEFFYASDIYPTHFRANTMFKLGYQAFMMMSIISAYIIIRISKTWKHIWFLIPSLFLVLLVLSYSYSSTISYYGAGENNLKEYQGLDGLKYLATSRPDDYKTILWMKKNIPGQPVILEAQGDSYTDYGRISINTGFPTVLGWTVHEWLWRGSYDVPAPRIEEVKQMYESPDINLTRQLLGKYNVEYVYVGDLEREKYPALYEDKFKSLGTVIFESGNSRLYKLF